MPQGLSAGPQRPTRPGPADAGGLLELVLGDQVRPLGKKLLEMDVWPHRYEGWLALWPAQERGGAAVVAAGDEGRGTVTRISSACGRQTYALSPGRSASLTSARFGQRPACHRRLGNRAHSAKLTSQPGIGRAAGKERGSSI